MHVIDVNTVFGRRLDQHPRYGPATLAAALDSHQVAAALTCSLQGAVYDCRAGNDESLAAARAHRALLPVATLDPRDWPGWEAELARCRARPFRAVRLFPGIQGWSVASTAFRRVLARVAENHWPVLISLAECGSAWQSAAGLAALTRDLQLPLVLLDANYMDMAELMAVMREHPHVHAETNWIAALDNLEILAAQVGADHLLYGSGAVDRPQQKALNLVLESALSAADKQAILAGNAQRVFGIADAELAGRPALAALEPRRFTEPVIDVHSHLGYWFCPNRDEDYDPHPMLARMKRFGITHSVLSAYESMRWDIAAGNRAVADAIAGHPELLGYVELNPHQLELSVAEMNRYLALPNFAGVEVELNHIAAETAGPEVRALFAAIAAHGKPVLFMPHGPDDAPAERDLARRHPDLAIIHAHGFDARWARTVADTPNILVEFNRSQPSHHDVRDALDILGADRVLFGTDQTLLSVGSSIGLYLDAGMTAAERPQVLHENARRVFGIAL